MQAEVAVDASRTLEFEGGRYLVLPGESVLDCLLRHGVQVSSCCRSGACQSCMLRVSAGQVPPASQRGIKATHQQQGLFLACMCKPTTDLSISRCEAAPSYASRVVRSQRLSDRVLGVWLERPAELQFRAGQFLQLSRPADGLMRPYSVASLPEQGPIELHVALLDNGRMSGWLARAAGEDVQIRGPFGECYYQEQEPDRPLLLAGTGTGLAPLLGVVRAAIHAGHRAPITLFHGVRERDGLYMAAELAELARGVASLRLVASVLDADVFDMPQWRVERAPLDQLILSQYPKLNAHRLYFCGNPSLVQRLKRGAFLAGAALANIHSDPFVLPADVAA